MSVGARVGEVHIDSGRSAWNPRVKRPAWERLMCRLEAGATGGVVVFDMARFSRRPIEGERLILAAEQGLATNSMRRRMNPIDCPPGSSAASVSRRRAGSLTTRGGRSDLSRMA